MGSTPRDALLPYMEAAHQDPRRLRCAVNTRSDIDHMGGNASLRELLSEAVLMCHALDRPMVDYAIYEGPAVAEFLAESRAFVARVDAALPQELRAAGSRTRRELIEALAPRLGAWTEGARYPLNQPLSGHLERLMQYGQVTTSRRDGLVAHRWVR